MARPATNPATRLVQLGKALEKAKALPRRQTLTAKPMCELLGVSWPTLQGWCDDIPEFGESGVFERGARGIEWTFRPVATIKALIKHFEAERDKRAAKARQVRKIVGGQDFDDAGLDLSIEELTKVVRLAAELQQQRERSGQLVDAAKAASAITMMCSKIQQAVLRAAQEEDHAGEWPPEIRESFENATRRILLKIELAAQECLSELRGDSSKPGELGQAG